VNDEPKTITVSREALRAELLDMELRLTRSISEALAKKADLQLLVALEGRVTAIATDLHARHDLLAKRIDSITEQGRVRDEAARVRKETIEEERDDRELKFNRWQTLLARATALGAVLVTIYFTHG
jgi:hypothetical protein